MALDHMRGAERQALGAILVRTESVASSKIERVEASTTGYARALQGNRSNAAATAMTAAITAIAAQMMPMDGWPPAEKSTKPVANRPPQRSGRGHERLATP